MTASFHLVHYRTPVIRPPRRLVGRVDGLRFWSPLNIGGDFGWFREHSSRWSLYRRLRPDFGRWAFYAVWEDESSLDEFLEASETARSWRQRTVESCHFSLRPRGARGSWEGTRLLDAPASGEEMDGPVAHLVRLDLSLRGTLAMWGSAAPGLLRHLPTSDEMLLGVPLVDRPYAQPVSFSVWRTADSAAAFAYRGRGHADAIARVRRSQRNLLGRYSAASFEPYRCQGTWNGRTILPPPTTSSA